ncbi:MAG: hypothetical protein WAL75_08225 [Terracidiphilus sp.]
MNLFRKTVTIGAGVMAVIAVVVYSAAQAPPSTPASASSQNAGPPAGPPDFSGIRHLPPVPAAANAARSVAPYFVPDTATPKAPDPDGFIQRWLLLEPIAKPNRTNTVFVGTYVRKTFATEYFPDQFTVVPHSGDKVTVAGQQLAWHSLDSTNFNVKLFRFAYGLNKPTYGVIFWAVTVVDSPREMKNIRLAVGSNSASMWWLNGQDVVDLFDDRRMVMDDGVSKRITLNKGRNVLRGAVINGPGMSDFCVRFIEEDGKPIRDLSMSLK